MALGQDAPEPRSVQAVEHGPVIEFPEVGGLHNRYERRAAQLCCFPGTVSEPLKRHAQSTLSAPRR
jgi:hypothetical protein